MGVSPQEVDYLFGGNASDQRLPYAVPGYVTDHHVGEPAM